MTDQLAREPSGKMETKATIQRTFFFFGDQSRDLTGLKNGEIRTYSARKGTSTCCTTHVYWRHGNMIRCVGTLRGFLHPNLTDFLTVQQRN